VVADKVIFLLPRRFYDLHVVQFRVDSTICTLYNTDIHTDAGILVFFLFQDSTVLYDEGELGEDDDAG
jgi:hypothetical protein